MSSMIERVAGAIAAESGQEWADCGVGYRQICTSFAIAAIKAMREPTDEMAEAGVETGMFDSEITLGNKQQAKAVFDAMLDAALKDARP